MNDNINFKLKVWKNGHENLKIQRLLLNIQIRCRISMKVLKIIKVIIVLDGNWIIYQEQKTKHFSCFITQVYFAVTNNIWLNFTRYFIVKTPIKKVLQQMAFNRSLNIDFKDFMNLKWFFTKNLLQNYIFLVNNTTLVSDNPLHFRKNPLEII